jgi:hypothetical protein
LKRQSAPQSNERVFWGVLAIILVAAALRIVVQIPNFSPVAGMALFAGAYLTRKAWAFAVPLAAMFVSDLALGFHADMPAVYLSFVLVTALGFALRENRTGVRVGLASVAASVLFFVLTNLSVWWTGAMYTHDFEGLVACFVAAIPFFQNTAVSDLIATGALFGGWELLHRYVIPQRQAQRSN